MRLRHLGRTAYPQTRAAHCNGTNENLMHHVHPLNLTFLTLLASTLAFMTWLAIVRPEAERVGVLRIPTTRGDRLFISLIMAAVIHLLWVGFIGTDTVATIPIGEEGIELSSLWLASAISLVAAVANFRTV